MDLPVLDVSHKWNQTVSDLLCLAVYILYTIPILALCLRYYYSRFADGKNKAWSNCAAQGHSQDQKPGLTLIFGSKWHQYF